MKNIELERIMGDDYDKLLYVCDKLELDVSEFVWIAVQEKMKKFFNNKEDMLHYYQLLSRTHWTPTEAHKLFTGTIHGRGVNND